MASGLTSTYYIPYPISTDPVNVHGDMQLMALQLEDVLVLKPDKNLPNILTKTNTYTIGGTDNGIIINQSGTGVPLKITNTGTGNSFLVEDSASTDSTPFVIDASGNVGIGKTTPTVLLDVAGIGAFSGALTASTFNALTLTSAATGFTIAGGTTSKTLTLSNTLTLAGTDATTMTFPSTSQSIAGLTATQLFTNKSLSDSTTFIVDAVDNTKRVQFDVTGTTAITGILQTAFTTAKTVAFQDVAGTVYVSTGTDVTLADGGTNASLTASNGGIVYSTATAMAILAGTATAGQMLQSGASTTPAWSTATFPSTATSTGTILRANGTNWVATTATYPTTTTINQILYSSAADTISGITTANNQVLVTNGSGVPAFSGTLPSGVTASSLTSFGTSPTLTTPTIDTINASAVGAATSLHPTVTTGSIAIGAGLTTGALNIATVGTGATPISIGHTNSTIGITGNTTVTGTLSTTGNATIGGDLTVNGTLTSVNSNTVNVDDKNLELGSVTAGTVSTTGTIGTVAGAGPFTATITGMSATAGIVPGSVITATAGTGNFGSGVMSVASVVSNSSITVSSTLTFTAGTVTNILGGAATDATANGGGITLKGATDKTILWDSTNSNWTSSENLNIPTGKTFKINNVSVLSSTAVLGITHTINATGYTLSGGTTAVAVTFAGGAAYTISGTNGTTITLPATTGTLPLNNQAFFIGTQSIAINQGTGTITSLPGVSSINGSTVPASVTLAANVTTTIGDLIYASATGTPGTLARLAGNITTTRKFLRQTGDATNSTAPVWDTLLDADIPSALTGKSYNGLTLTSTTGTFTLAAAKTLTVSNTITLTGTDGVSINLGSTNGTLGSAAFTASSAYEPAITTLAISKGGTGTTTAPTQYGVIYATSTTAYASTAAGASTQVLIGNASGAPTWTNISGLSVSSATTATNLSGTTLYSIPYQSASATTGYVAIGTAGQVLTVNGTTNGYTWSSPFTNPMTTLGDMVSGGASGAPVRLIGPATNGTYGLTSVTTASAATAPVWTLATGTGSPVYATSPTITTPKIDSINTVAGAAATPTIYSDVTTGTITIGAGITTGTVNIATAGTGANAINIGNTNSTLTVNGNLTVNGTTTTVNSVTIAIDDPNLELNSVASPSDANANGGGITVKATTDKTIIWDSTNSNWTSNQDWNLVTGKVFKINNVAVLSPTVVLGITPTINATGFSLAGGTTSKTLTVQNTLTLAGTDSSTLNIGTGGTLGTAAFTAATAYEPAITTLAISKGGTGTTTAPTQYGIIYAGSTTAYASTVAGTASQVLTGSATVPVWTNTNSLSVLSAATLTTPRTINGVSFDGSANITISAAADAGTLTGSTLAAGVTASSLTSLGTLTSLTVSGNLTVSGVVTVPTPTNNTDAANKAYVDSVLSAGVPEIVPLDDISGEFNGVDSIFVPKYQGIKQSITNPLRLMLSINGIIQYVDFPDYVWQSPLPREGFQINNDGNIAFSEVVPVGSRFNAMIQPGPNTITKKRQYPFKAMDILLGG